jgi:NodT family efflux transporter outer membrane factor (OMF) lipoprotein
MHTKSVVLSLTLLLTLLLFGCTKLGPNYVRPPTSIMRTWTEAGDTRTTQGEAEWRAWWRVFDDPVLDGLIETAYQQNLTLRVAGVRVLEARAQLALAKGQLFPQTQQAIGSLQYNRLSEHSPLAVPGAPLSYTQDEIGVTASWEIDFWGKFRRAIESAGASLKATLADYDNAIVSLTADVASDYIQIRTLDSRIQIARQNVETQAESLFLAQARYEFGTASERDVEQARTVLENTKAAVPVLQAGEEQTRHALAILLGLPPGDLAGLLRGPSVIPSPPPQIAVGIPEDLLRRRPDVRSAEYQAVAQGAQIGVARAALFPAFSLSGTFVFLSTDLPGSKLSDIAKWGSRDLTVGPGFTWNVFNYGRLENNVRIQDARFQELLIAYQNAVLAAQQDVEDSLVAYLRAEDRADSLAASVEAARKSLDYALQQYRGGITDFTTVVVAEQALLTEQDAFAANLGTISTSLVSVYRALGGGWQAWEGKDPVPEDVRQVMARRTNWGDLLLPVRGTPDDEERRLPEGSQER